MELLKASYILIFISTSYFPPCLTFTRKFPPTLGLTGWGSSPSMPITGAVAGGSGTLSATQATDVSQSISLQASGPGMNLNFTSNLEGVAGAGLEAGGATTGVDSSGSVSAAMNETSVSTILVPVSQIGLEMEGATLVDLDVESLALGWENVDADVSHSAQAISGNYIPASVGGWKQEIS